MNGPQHDGETIVVIGAGQMGAAVGRRMREAGARVLTTLTGRSAASVNRVKEAGLEAVDDDDRLVAEASVVLSIVPPSQATHVAERFRAPIERSANKPIFAECNAVAPATVRRIAALLAPSGCPFVDAGIIGGPPPAGRLDAGPRFYASGPDAAAFTQLAHRGLDIVALDGPIGSASALKLSYAGLTKGITALGAAMVAAATRDGLAGALRNELARSQPEILTRIRRTLPAMLPKAYRWVGEMEEISAFVGDPQTGAEIYAGAARLYQRIAEDVDSGGGPDAVLLGALRSFLRA